MNASHKHLHHELAKQATSVCQRLLPNGVEYRGEWIVGSVDGEAGSSMRVRLNGEKAGVFFDAATGDTGDMIQLWMMAGRLSFKEAINEIYAHLGLQNPDDDPRKKPSRTWNDLQREMGTGTEHDIAALAQLRNLPTDAGIRLAIENGHLFFGPYAEDGEAHPSWIITDAARITAQVRRMDGKPWNEKIGKSKTVSGTSGKWPVGIKDCALTEIAFTEGSPDFIAAYTAVAMLGIESRIQPVTMLGASQPIHPEALPLFANKLIWMFPHNDGNYAGLKGAFRWEKELLKVRAQVIPFDFSAYPGVKDLNDFLSALTMAPQPAAIDDWGND